MVGLFIQKHNKLFVWLGALVVFIGFFAKEGARENLRDLSSELESARNSYNLELLMARNQATSEEILYYQGAQNVKDMEAAHELIDKLMDDELEVAKGIEEDTERLSEHIRFPEDSLVDNRKAAEGAIQQFTLDVNKLKALPSLSPELSPQLAVLNKDSALCKETIVDFRKQVEDGAEEEASKDRTMLRIITILVYVLFAIGWTVGLLGKVTKAVVPEEQQEP